MGKRRQKSLPREMHIDLDKELFNDAYFEYLREVYTYEVYYGGSGSGKSTFIGQKLALQMSIFPGRNLACLRRQKTDCISSCWAEIYNSLSKFKLLPYWDIRENPTHCMTNRVNGNVIIFDGVDNIEDIKSIKFTQKVEGTPGDNNLTDVWYEEANAEPTADTIRELDRRLRDREIKTRIILSFNPVSRNSWLFEYVTKELKMPDTDSLIVHTTYKDNKFLPEDYGPKLERFKYTDPYSYQVYALGNWGTTGQTVFDANKIQEQIDRISGITFETGDFLYETKNKVLDLQTAKFCRNIEGNIVIFKKPEKNVPYVAGIDTAGEGSDFYVCQIINNKTGEQVARFKSDKNPDKCVWQVICLMRMYNNALAAPEINFDTWIIKALKLVDYPNIYIRKSPQDKKHIRTLDKLGWRTQPDNRQLMLTDLVFWTNENMRCINDIDTLNDMLTFTRQDKKLKGIWWGAEPGSHDDTVMAFAITLQARSQQHTEFVEDDSPLTGYWTREELEDAIAEKRISHKQKHDYVSKFGYYAEDTERIERKKVSRYAR